MFAHVWELQFMHLSKELVADCSCLECEVTAVAFE